MKSSKPAGRTLRRTAATAALSVMVAAALAACSSGSGTSSPSTSSGGSKASAITAALKKGGTITVWSWAPQTKDIVAGFEKKYPNVTVKLVNAGTGTAEYTKLQDAISAGSGAPDVAQIEYYALPQFALGGSLVNLSSIGFNSVKSDFSSAVWDSVYINSQLEALPQDTGPMALFYNKKIFDKYGLSVPATWDQYIADAKKLHTANPKEYITNDAGDPGLVTSMIWDAGGQAYKLSGTKSIAIDLQDAGSKKFAAMWNQLLEGGLLSPIAGWSNQWYQGLANGSIASLITGAWMPGDLESGVQTGSGDWRVAPLPTYTAGTPATSENGGSSDAILKQSKNQLVAAGFLQYENIGAGAQTFAKEGGFPSLTSILNSSSFQSQAPAYFGGQKINQVLSAAASSVIPGWSYLPYQVYANSIFGDSVGKAYANQSDLNAGLKAWQQSTASYGKQQGFTITTGN